jgi:hypothetical protein
VPLTGISLHNDHIKDDAEDPERCEYLVPVHCESAVPRREAKSMSASRSNELGPGGGSV